MCMCVWVLEMSSLLFGLYNFFYWTIDSYMLDKSNTKLELVLPGRAMCETVQEGKIEGKMSTASSMSVNYPFNKHSQGQVVNVVYLLAIVIPGNFGISYRRVTWSPDIHFMWLVWSRGLTLFPDLSLADALQSVQQVFFVLSQPFINLALLSSYWYNTVMRDVSVPRAPVVNVNHHSSSTINAYVVNRLKSCFRMHTLQSDDNGDDIRQVLGTYAITALPLWTHAVQRSVCWSRSARKLQFPHKSWLLQQQQKTHTQCHLTTKSLAEQIRSKLREPEQYLEMCTCRWNTDSVLGVVGGILSVALRKIPFIPLLSLLI